MVVYMSGFLYRVVLRVEIERTSEFPMWQWGQLYDLCEPS